ncbi:MAG: hypothetical protein PHY08_09025 [Candidatus Cloacimonetes bacterium]|nr:hypothetical protein [Candidatus Cloacimonadota bacterium]
MYRKFLSFLILFIPSVCFGANTFLNTTFDHNVQYGTVTITGQLNIKGYSNVATQLGAIATSTTSIGSSLSSIATATATLHVVDVGLSSWVAQIALDTATIVGTDISDVKVDTGTLRTDLNAVKLDTGTLRTDLAAVKVDTGTLSDTIADLSFDVQIATSELKFYIDNNFNEKLAFETVTDTSTLTISSNCIIICDILAVETGTWTLTLPIATDQAEVGKVFEIKNMSDANQFISIDAGAKTIDGGASTYCLDPLNTLLRIALKPDYNWIILGKYTP